MLNRDGKDCCQKIDEPLGVSRVFVVEVQPVVFLADLDHSIEGVVLQNQLLDIEERFLMLDMLSHLNTSAPSVRSKLFLAVVALSVGLDKLYHESLLDLGLVIQLFFDCDFDFDSLGMFLRPNEPGIDDSRTIQSSDFLKQNS